jgi:TonB-dependent starch-binding outer membrane protein SusC
MKINTFFIIYPLVIIIHVTTGALLFSQKKTVTGIVTESEYGNRLKGAVVKLKGTNKTKISDEHGFYQIIIPEDATLIFSHPGYESTEINNPGEEQNITLIKIEEQDADLIDKFYADIYQVSENTFKNVITEEEIDLPGYFDFAQGLQGKLPGLNIRQSSGLAGAFSKLTIRGPKTIHLSSSPLVVFNGMPVMLNLYRDNTSSFDAAGGYNPNMLSFVDVASIEKITLLQGSSAAIFGARGANGVLLINTMDTKTRESRFNVHFSTGISEPLNSFKFIDNQAYIDFVDEARKNDQIFNGPHENPAYQGLYGEVDKKSALNNNTDWQNKVLRNGSFSDLHVSYHYGNDTFQIGGNMRLYEHHGPVNNNEQNAVSSNVFFGYKPIQKLETRFNLNFNRERNKHALVSEAGGLGIAQSVALPVYAEDAPDSYFELFTKYHGNVSFNPVRQIKHHSLESKNNSTLLNLQSIYEITSDLNVYLNTGFHYLDNEQQDYKDSLLLDLPSGSQLDRQNLTWQITLNPRYNIVIDDVHSFHYGLFTEFFTTKFQQEQLFASGIDRPLDADPLLQGKEFTNNSKPELILEKLLHEQGFFHTTYPDYSWSLLSFAGTASYNYKNTYSASIGLRADGNTKFGKNNKFAYFPHVRGSWTISNLKSWEIEYIDYLKISSGFSMSGNSSMHTEQQFGIVSTEGRPYNENNTIETKKLPNPDLKWETTWSFDIGLDFIILEKKIAGKIECYHEQTRDIIQHILAPLSSGWESLYLNNGKMCNTGFLFNLRTKNLQGIVNWTTSVNFTLTRNRFQKQDDYYQQQELEYSPAIPKNNRPYPAYRIMDFSHISQKNGLPVYQINGKENTNPENMPLSGFMYKGQVYPFAFGSVHNHISYYGFDLGFMFYFSLGNTIYDYAGYYQQTHVNAWNLRKDIYDRWQKPGNFATVPRLTLKNNPYNQYKHSDHFMYDGSYIRLRNLTLGYNIPGNIPERLRLKKIHLFFSIQNLFTLSKFDTYDPEFYHVFDNYTEMNLNPSFFYLEPPQVRTFKFGLNMTF